MKRILVFCDGTGQDGLIVPDGPTEFEKIRNGGITGEFSQGALKTLHVVASQPELYRDSVEQTLTAVSNILRLSRAVKQVADDGTTRQIVYYQSGVGTEADFMGDMDWKTSPLQQAYGVIVASKIRNTYAFVAQNFEEGDEIFLFGFSRGAYTARKVAGLIDKIGLLQPEELGIFFNIWKELIDKKSVTPPSGTRFPTIKCLGVFDTVGSVKNTIDVLEIKDNSLPNCVNLALHAVSLHENREKFLPTLFNPATHADKLVEVWFPGAHSDVGGSYDRHELADISLFWMAGEIKKRSLFALDYKFIERSKQMNPDDWGTSQPHNAWYESSYIVRQAVGHKTRLESSQISDKIQFHESWKHSPLFHALLHSKYMIAPDKLPFTVTNYAPMNQFEIDCRSRWKDNIGDPQAGMKDNVGILLPRTGLEARFAIPYITFTNKSTLPAAPQGLWYAWLSDPSKTDSDNARVPIFLYEVYMYTVLTTDNNDDEMVIIAWDVSKHEKKRVTKSGARYIWKIDYDSATESMIFSGQSKRTVTATLKELSVE
ncbi:hypothetical protein MIND_00436800 [Mycena indigotica]|uniref:T6SS Phospholipase effector Tle1-like catalytic domain-containing protein n=1 Tax=Mycena indigotica TaxID=2126181 RepID=A0A8H6SVY9_9AGAR|nr:uncharacterized protein MIND_00436800 [Mycena indigotica]KAF7306456.1 hypothetical protein MIND_00436800 [Mycena indigotica]